MWQQQNPKHLVSNTEECEEFMDIACNALGGGSDEETTRFRSRIMRNILKEITIDKTQLIPLKDSKWCKRSQSYKQKTISDISFTSLSKREVTESSERCLKMKLRYIYRKEVIILGCKSIKIICTSTYYFCFVLFLFFH